MPEYWAYRIGEDQPYVGWIEQHSSPNGTYTSLHSIGMNGSDSIHNNTKPTAEEAIREEAARRTIPGHPPNLTIARYLLEPGQHHPRIFRNPNGPHPKDRKKAMLSAESAARGPLEMLEGIFSTVEPDPATAAISYGQTIRHFIILACTEVEAGWAGVLAANHYSNPRLSTVDYVKLLKPMRLDEYVVKLVYHPDYPEIRPFQGWDQKSPTASLPWYDAYNAVKHNRELNLSKATLAHAISAAAAMCVMSFAQFGREISGQKLLQLTIHPQWAPEEIYYPPSHPKDWAPVDCKL